MVVELDLADVEPSIAGPKRPQDRIPLSHARSVIGAILNEGSKAPDDLSGLDEASAESFPASDPIAFGKIEESEHPVDRSEPEPHQVWPSNPAAVTFADGRTMSVDNGHVVIAAITSCTNTSNPSVMIGAGLMAKKAVELGLSSKPWVKTSLAPGSRVVTDYYDKAGLTPYLNQLGLRPRRVRLHHLHRQLGTADPRGGRRGHRERPQRERRPRRPPRGSAPESCRWCSRTRRDRSPAG